MSRISIRDMRRSISKKLAALSGRFCAVSRHRRAWFAPTVCAESAFSALPRCVCAADDACLRQMIVKLRIRETTEIGSISSSFSPSR